MCRGFFFWILRIRDNHQERSTIISDPINTVSMSGKKKRKAAAEQVAKARAAAENRWAGESKAVEIMTVGWLISAMVTSFAILGWIAMQIYLLMNTDALANKDFLAGANIFRLYLLTMLIATGSITLVLTFLTNRMRIKRAPRPIVRTTLAISVIALGLAAWMIAGR